MSKQVCHYVWNEFLNDRLYDLNDPVLNLDGHQRGHILLREHLLSLGVELHTQDVTPPQKADLIYVENSPVRDTRNTIASLRSLGKPMLLCASESIAVLTANNDASLLEQFDRVFTYQDRLLGNPRYRKFNYTFDLPRKLERREMPFAQKKLLCGISANKRSSEAGELYSERVRLYRWFDKHAPEHFDLYGPGWERPHKVAAPLYRRRFLHKWPLRFIFAPPFRCWRGRVERKAEVVSSYRFTVCFENTCAVDGYITEKIFDAMLCGAVPIYWGAPNVTDYIPADTFVDYRKLGSPKALYEYLMDIDEKRHAAYLDAIEAFFRSEQSDVFRFAFYINSVSEEICNRLNIPFRPFQMPESPAQG